MVHIVWEFLVRADRLPEFERHYSGVDGPWAQLFGKSPGFRGTVLLRNTEDPRHFLTIDFLGLGHCAGSDARAVP